MYRTTRNGEPKVKPFSLQLITWNYGRGGNIHGYSFAKIRDIIVPLMFRQVKGTAIICHQEVSLIDKNARIKFLDHKPKIDYYESCQEKGCPCKSRQAISFPYKLGDYNIDCQDVSDEFEVGVYKQRYYSKLITVSRGVDKVRFVLVSLHAPYKVKKREKKLKEFLKDVCITIADKENVPVIVGGDFNLDVTKWRNSIMAEFTGRVFVALPDDGVPDQPHSTKKIDTFLVVYPKFTPYIVDFQITIPICPIPMKGHITDDETKLVDLERSKIKLLHYNKSDFNKLNICEEKVSDLNKLIDHYPVMTTIDITPTKHWCFYAVDSNWQQKACKTLKLDTSITSSIKKEYRGDASTPLRCPDFHSVIGFKDERNSLFCAFSYIITGSKDHCMKVRDKIVEYMEQNEHNLSKKISTLGTEAEISTLAHLLKTSIYMYFYRDKDGRSNGNWFEYRPKHVTSDMSMYITNHYEVVRKQRKK